MTYQWPLRAAGALAGITVCLGMSGCWQTSTQALSPELARLTAEYRPLSPVIGQPLTVMGYCDLSPKEVASEFVRIQLVPDGANSLHRVDLGTASLVAGHFSWSDTLKPAYGGVTIKASDSLTLFVVLPEVRTTDGRSLGSREAQLDMTPVATAGP